MNGVNERRGARRDLNPLEKRDLVRALATLGDRPLSELADEWDLSYESLRIFRRERAREIRAVAEDLDDQFAGLWIANKQARIAAYMDEFEIAMKNKNMSHHEWIKTRAALLRAVADELGQIPGRGGLIVVPVEHVIVNIDVEELK